MVLSEIKPFPGCEEKVEPSTWFRDTGLEYEIEQMVGGTRGTDYVYIRDNGVLVNISYFRGAKRISVERWGRGRRREVYRVSKHAIQNRMLVRIGFTNSGYMHVDICYVHKDAIECYWCSSTRGDWTEYLVRMFKPIGGERSFLEFYRNFIPKFVKDIEDVRSRSRTETIVFGGHAQRLREVLEDPYLSLLSTLALNTWQGRILSLQEKVSHVAELWVLVKVIEAIDGETLQRASGRIWWIEFTKNYPFAIVRSRVTGKEYTIFYQPSIYPHVIPGFLANAPKHLVPDIVVFDGVINEFIDWGELYKVIEAGKQPLLVIEVKTGLETSEWRKPDYIYSQLEEYKTLLKSKHIVLAVLTQLKDILFKARLKHIGVDVFENLLSTKALEGFKSYIVETLS